MRIYIKIRQKISRIIKQQLLKIQFGKKLQQGKNCIIDYNTIIELDEGQLILEKNVFLRSNIKKYHAGMPFPTRIFSEGKDAVIKIGNNSRLNGVCVHARKHIEIGANCVIASGVQIIDSNGHELKSLDRTKGTDKASDIYIGTNVWIGINAVILKGTNIGDNSVVSANSVVKGTFPSNSIITGNPAIIVGTIKFD